jgi:hypothetical protein
VGIFVSSRAAIWALAATALAWWSAAAPANADERGYGAGLWVRWDSAWFLEIARNGYGRAHEQAEAFFPLYPGFVAGLGRALGDFPLAGLLVSLVACLVAFELLWRLADRFVGPQAASRSVLYLAIFPMALFLQASYSESLFLAFAVGAFLAAERDRWAVAAVAAGGALLTRSVGIAVIAGLAVLAWPSLRRLAWLLLSLAFFLAFPIVLHLQAGNALGFLNAQDAWDRSLSPEGPFGGIWDGIVVLGHRTDNFTEAHFLAVNIEDLVFLGLFLALLPLVWRRLGAAYGVYAAVALALPLTFPGGTGDFPLISLPRFGLLIFPYFIVLALLGRDERAHTAIVALSALGLGAAVVLWSTFQWVA